MLPDNMEVGWNISKNVESAYMQLTFAVFPSLVFSPISHW